MQAVLNEIVELMTNGIISIGSAIGDGLSAIAHSVFLTEGAGDATQLSTFGALIVIFAGISLALGLARWVLNFCTSLGARNR